MIDADRPAWSAWLAGAVGLALTLWLFFPGYMSWDSAYQWWQVRHGIVDPIFPPVMGGIWRVTEWLSPGPGGYFLYQATLYWLAFAAFAAALSVPAWARVLIVLGLGLWPPVWAVSTHVWKDAAMLSWFVLAVACLCQDARRPSRGLRLLALACIAVGAAYRYNALSAALPLCLWLGWREMQALRGPTASRIAGAGLGLGMLVVVALASAAPGLFATKTATPVWPVIAQWDIAAASIAEDRNLFPPRWADPTLTLPELRAAFNPAVNTTLYETGKVTLVYETPMSDADLAALRAAWLDLPLSHPRAYFGHRLRVARLMFGLDQAEHPNHLVLSPTMVAYLDNPPVVMNATRWHTPVQDWLQSWIDTPLFAGWIYAAFALLMLIVAAFDRRRAGTGLAMTIAASGLLLVLPLVLLSPSTDFRYINWLLSAALMAPLAWLFARRPPGH